MYSQFVYGKFAGGQGGYKIVAHTEDLDVDRINQIAQKYKFWGNTPPQGPKKAVGFFVEEGNQSELVFFQVNHVTGNYGKNFNQYRYTLVPIDEMKKLGYRSYRLLIWLKKQNIPSIKRYNPKLERLQIPILAEGISKERKQREAKLVEDCLQEKDRQEKPFLLSAISALINGRRVLVNNVDSYLSAPNYYLASIFALLPAICRSEISVAVGNIDEQKCDWARAIVKDINSESVSLPQNCIWLNRMRNAVIGYDSQNSWQSGYVRRIDEIISENPHNIPEIIAELDRITEPRIKLESLIRVPEGNYGSSQDLIKLGLWGGPRSGKTTYLTMLQDSIQRGGSYLKIIDMDSEARRFVQYNSRLIANGKFPPATDPAQNYRPNMMTYRLMNSASLRRIEIPLNFVDAPGEFYIQMANYEEVDWQAEPVEEADREAEPVEEDDSSSISIRGYIDYLIQCDGLIFMLSPDAPRDGSESYRNLLPRLFQVLRARARRLEKYSKLDNQGRLKQFIAFCVSKADRAEVWENRDRPIELAKEILGEAIESLPTYCYFDENYPDDPERNRCKFFAISSIGRYQNSEGQWVEAVQYPQGSSPESEVDIFYDEDDQINQEDESNSQEQPVESESSDSNDDDWGWGEASDESEDRSEETDSRSFSEGATIDKSVKIVPFKVIAPVEWLIKNLQANPLSEAH